MRVSLWLKLLSKNMMFTSKFMRQRQQSLRETLDRSLRFASFIVAWFMAYLWHDCCQKLGYSRRFAADANDVIELIDGVVEG